MNRGKVSEGGADAILSAVFLGAILGAAARILDIYSEFFGTIFSHIAVWILLSVVLAFRSVSPKWAAVRVGLFLITMVAVYYAVAEWTNGVWSESFLIGWGMMAVLSPIPGYLVWYARRENLLAWVLRAGVLIVQIAATLLLFDHLNGSDMLIIALTAALLLRRRSGGNREA